MSVCMCTVFHAMNSEMISQVYCSSFLLHMENKWTFCTIDCFPREYEGDGEVEE